MRWQMVFNGAPIEESHEFFRQLHADAGSRRPTSSRPSAETSGRAAGDPARPAAPHSSGQQQFEDLYRAFVAATGDEPEPDEQELLGKRFVEVPLAELERLKAEAAWDATTDAAWEVWSRWL